MSAFESISGVRNEMIAVGAISKFMVLFDESIAFNDDLTQALPS